MLTVVFLAAVVSCFLLLGIWLRLMAMEEKFDHLMMLLVAPQPEEEPEQEPATDLAAFRH